MIRFSKAHTLRMQKAFTKMKEYLNENEVLFEEEVTDDYKGDFPRFNLTIQTDIGKMTVHLFEDWIATKFACPDKAVERLGDNVNHFSGKHNYYIGNQLPPHQVMGEIYRWFTYTIDRVI